MRPIGDRELLARGQQVVRTRMRVGQELLGALSVVLEQVDREGNLQGRLLPRLPRLSLEQLRDPLIVVEQPVTQAPGPLAPAGRSERLPGWLRRSRETAARTSSALWAGTEATTEPSAGDLTSKLGPGRRPFPVGRAPTSFAPAVISGPLAQLPKLPTARSAMPTDTRPRRIDICADSIEPLVTHFT
jgi:hypothetical protein